MSNYLSNKNEYPQYPEALITDEFKKWLKSTIGDILPLGNTFTSIFSSLIIPKLEKRREEFLRDVAYWIMKLSKQNENFRPENLVKNELFISTIHEVVRCALKTQNNEKLKSLRNALISTVELDEKVDIKKVILLNEIESLTELHILLLKFIWNLSGGKSIIEQVTDSKSNDLKSLQFRPKVNSMQYVYDEYLKSHKDFRHNKIIFIKVLNDLNSREFIKINQPGNRDQDFIYEEVMFFRTVVITEIGNDLVNLIKNPNLD